MEWALLLAIGVAIAWIVRRKAKKRNLDRFKRADTYLRQRADDQSKEWRTRQPESTIADAASIASARVGYRMVYADAYGVVTERTIQSPTGEIVDGTVYVEAWCSLRRSRRTFRAERISELYAPGGDRLYDPLSYFADLAEQKHRPQYGRRFPEHEKAIDRLRPSLSAMVWIARADRDVDTSEMAILKEFSRRRLQVARGASGIDEHRLEAWIDDTAPTKATALKALSEIGRGGPISQVFMDHAERLVRSSGSVDAAKADRLRQLVRAL